ncbi:MAG: hypothetical protein RR313_03000 [Anaerovoracaceae bacterium]
MKHKKIAFVILIFISGMLFYYNHSLTVAELEGFPLEKNVENIEALILGETGYVEKDLTDDKKHLIYSAISKQEIKPSGFFSDFPIDKKGQLRIVMYTSKGEKFIMLLEEGEILVYYNSIKEFRPINNELKKTIISLI